LSGWRLDIKKAPGRPITKNRHGSVQKKTDTDRESRIASKDTWNQDRVSWTLFVRRQLYCRLFYLSNQSLCFDGICTSFARLVYSHRQSPFSADPMQKCPLCHCDQVQFFHQDKKRAFYCCDTCDLVFADAASHLPPMAERQRYGRSRISQKQKQLSQFVFPFLKQLQQLHSGQLTGLNFGRILEAANLKLITDAGHILNQYDPFLAPEHTLLKREYDFIVCYRVFEHFQYPMKEWHLLSRLLNPGGWLAINTPLLTDLQAFGKWHHKNNLTHVSFYQKSTFEYLAANSEFTLLFAAKDLILMQKTSGSDIKRGLISHLGD
jgi:hypothetical protein